LDLVLTWTHLVLQKKYWFDYGSDAKGMERRLKVLEGAPTQRERKSLRAASPIASQGKPTE